MHSQFTASTRSAWQHTCEGPCRSPSAPRPADGRNRAHASQTAPPRQKSRPHPATRRCFPPSLELEGP
eukprot:15479208-Alexandrium_andersonii.AAC.1